MKIAFAGFDHDHVHTFYHKMKNDSTCRIVGAWETREDMVEHRRNDGIEITHTSYQKMLQECDADTIVVGTCFSDRGRTIIEALRAGKHVLSDKPVCTSLSELQEIKSLLQKTGLKLGCMLNMRYKPKVCAVRRLIRAGEIGEVKTVYMGMQHPLHYEFRAPWYFEEGKHGGTINDIGVHGIDLLYYLTGLTPDKVLAARCFNAFAPKETGFRDSGQFMATLSNGAGLLADVSYSVPDRGCAAFHTHFEIFGTLGAVRFSWNNAPATLYYKDKETTLDIQGEDMGDRSFWTDFLAEIQGKAVEEAEGYLTTADVVRATEYALQIQDSCLE